MGEPRVRRWRLASSLAGRGGGAEGDGDGSSFTHVGADNWRSDRLPATGACPARCPPVAEGGEWVACGPSGPPGSGARHREISEQPPSRHRNAYLLRSWEQMHVLGNPSS